MFSGFASHPGTITFIAPDGSERVQSAAETPDCLKFANGRGGMPEPVVLIAQIRSGKSFALRSYGADGRLLAITPLPAGSLPTRQEGVSGWF